MIIMTEEIQDQQAHGRRFDFSSLELMFQMIAHTVFSLRLKVRKNPAGWWLSNIR
jgi:hypothetical protein